MFFEEHDDMLCFCLKPFNHSHKVAKFCYADKVSLVETLKQKDFHCFLINIHLTHFENVCQKQLSAINVFKIKDDFIQMNVWSVYLKSSRLDRRANNVLTLTSCNDAGAHQ